MIDPPRFISVSAAAEGLLDATTSGAALADRSVVVLCGARDCLVTLCGKHSGFALADHVAFADALLIALAAVRRGARLRVDHCIKGAAPKLGGAVMASMYLNRELALRLGEAGFSIFPCSPKKKPALVGWQTLSTTNPEEIAKLWKGRPNALPGIDCAKSGLVVLDGDRHSGPDGADGVAELEYLLEEHAVDHCLHPGVRTPRDGKHFYFRQNGAELTNSPGDLPDGIDIRGKGGYIIAPHTQLLDGRSYEPIAGTPDLLTTPIDAIPYAPEWLVDIVRPRPKEPPRGATFNASGTREQAYARKALEGSADEIAATSSGKRNKTLNAVAYRLGRMVARGWLIRGEVEARLLSAAYSCGLVAEDGLRAAENTIKSGLNAGEKVPHPDLEDRQSEQDARTNDADEEAEYHEAEDCSENENDNSGTSSGLPSFVLPPGRYTKSPMRPNG